MRKLEKVLALCLLLIVLVAFVGCREQTVEGIAYTKDDNGRILFEEGTTVWSWESSRGVRTVAKDDIVILTVERGTAAMAEHEDITIALDQESTPVSITMPWETILTEDDYANMEKALEYDRLAEKIKPGTPWLAILIMIVLLAGGILIEIYGKKLVNTDSYDPSGKADKKLGTLRIIAGVIIALAAIVLLILIFA